MKDIQLPVGKKVYSLRCDSKDAEKIQDLSYKLNKIINQNTIKYKGLSDDNIILLTMLEFLDSNNITAKPTETKSVKEDKKKQLPQMYHPYPDCKTNSSTQYWTVDLFGNVINEEEIIFDRMILAQDQILKSIETINNLLGSILLYMSDQAQIID